MPDPNRPVPPLPRPPHWTNDPAPAPEPIVVVPEEGGRNGPDPTRYGDWENKGIAIDF
jgi:hypothetical protein